MKTRIYVKPVTDATDAFGWLTLSMNILESFVDDRRRFGLWKAIKNYIKTLMWL